MATPNNIIFHKLSELLAGGDLDWPAATDIRALLLAGDGTPAKDASTVTAVLGTMGLAELDATDYVRKTLANQSVNLASNVLQFLADNVVWTGLGNGSNDTASAILVYKGTLDDADDGTNVPLVLMAASEARTTTGEDATWEWPANGVVALQHPAAA